jgi:hypothetical protein
LIDRFPETSGYIVTIDLQCFGTRLTGNTEIIARFPIWRSSSVKSPDGFQYSGPAIDARSWLAKESL